MIIVLKTFDLRNLKFVVLLRHILFPFCCLALMSVTAQKKINKNYTFADGVYSNHQEFKNNKPSLPLYRIPDFSYKLDGEDNLLFLSAESISKIPESKIKSKINLKKNKNKFILSFIFKSKRELIQILKKLND